MSLHPDFVAELRTHFTGDIRLDLASRILYSTDASIYQIEPLGVVIPRTQEDLQAAVELAAKYRVPILPRGAGSSLAGQAIGQALILDCSRWLDRIMEVDAEMRSATVEPGVVLADLNRVAARNGLQYGPDPASAERATMGGVIANNATGAHSILYGMTADHLSSAEVIFSDGSLATLGTIQEPKHVAQESGIGNSDAAASSRYAAFASAALAIREGSAEAIKTHFPRTWRNSAGYRLNYLLPWSPAKPPRWSGDKYPPVEESTINLATMLAGSEGTLAVIRRATVNLVPKPKHTVLGILIYESIADACDAVPALLEHNPSAIELIPQVILRLARSVPAYARQMEWARGDPPVILAVEFSGERLDALNQAAHRIRGDVVVVESAEEQARVWNVRKVGLGILDSRPQSARPAAFIEDCAIPIERLGDFVREIERILADHKTQGGIYAHASAGCLHVRPVLNLKTREGVRFLRQIAEQVLALTLRLGGSMVSEHGEGIARGEWLKQTYGQELMEAMRALKMAADPLGLLGPGKLMDAPAMDTQLRYGAEYQAHAWAPAIDFTRNGGVVAAIEQCNGQGVCRKDTGTMCPSFQATRDEMHSTRGRANLLRAMIKTGIGTWESGVGNRGSGREKHDLEGAVFDALDLCLACKGCKAECPSSVDMAKLKFAFLAEYYKTHRRPARDYLFGYFHVTARWLSSIAPIVNLATTLPLARQLAARLMKITTQRPFPKFAWQPARPIPLPTGSRVFFLCDPFTHYVESRVERAAFKILFAAGYDVQVLPVMGAGAGLMSKGFLDAARRHARLLLGELKRRDPDGRVPVLALEPSELNAFKHDYLDLLPELAGEARNTTKNSWLVEDFLVRSGSAAKLRIVTTNTKVILHPHCHQKAEPWSVDEEGNSINASIELLEACGYEVELLDAGCCGMAGTFGYEAEHYQLSQDIGSLRLFPLIKETKNALVAATGAACRMQIAQGTEAAVEHPIVHASRALQEP